MNWTVRSSAEAETILLVDDEPAICSLVERVLLKEGFCVLVATKPSEALNMLAGYSGQISLAVLDVLMPEITGPELAEKLRAKLPDLKVLFISGFTEGHLTSEELLKKGAALLQKPFTQQALVQAVRRALDE